MILDAFNDYEEAGYLQNSQRLPLGDDLKQLEHEDFSLFLPDALTYLSSLAAPNYDDLLEVHKIVFEGVYPTWAGKDRQELTPHTTVHKGNTVFAQPYNLRKSFDIAMKRETLGKKLGDLAYTHPFLDGNGRAIFTFFDDHIRRTGQLLQWHNLDKDEFLLALTKQIDRPAGDFLDEVLQAWLVPLPPCYNHQQSSLRKVSWSTVKRKKK